MEYLHADSEQFEFAEVLRRKDKKDDSNKKDKKDRRKRKDKGKKSDSSESSSTEDEEDFEILEDDPDLEEFFRLGASEIAENMANALFEEPIVHHC